MEGLKVGVTQTIMDNIKMVALDEFDNASYIGWGTSNQAESPADTDLIASVIRKAFDEVPIKNTSAGIYDFSATLGLTEANSNTLRETGLFDISSGGDMFIRKLLPVEIAKDSTKEVSVSMRVTITVTEV
jgi:hypothetical protein